jgi:hypothetical protein
MSNMQTCTITKNHLILAIILRVNGEISQVRRDIVRGSGVKKPFVF